MDFGWGPNGHGPYLVRQEGYAPGSTQFDRRYFILQRDGHWLVNLAFVMLPEEEQERQLLHSLSEVLLCFEDICTKPVLADDKLPAGFSDREIMTRFENCTNRILRGMRGGKVMPVSTLSAPPP